MTERAANPRRKSRGGMTAGELRAKLAADPEYQRRLAERDAEVAIRLAYLSQAEQPIVEDLRSAGVGAGSVWDLVNTSEAYPAALPVLLRHLEKGGYPENVMESLGRAMAVRPAAFAWDTLRELFLQATTRGEEGG